MDDAVDDHLDTKDGENAHLKAEFVKKAMKERIDHDGYGDVEAMIDRLVSAAGRSPQAFDEEKISRQEVTTGRDTETTKMYHRVDEDLKAAFKYDAKENSDDRVGVHLAKALLELLDGGRSERLDRKLSRVVDDCEQFLQHVNSDTDDSIPQAEREVHAFMKNMRNEFSDMFTADDLRPYVNNVTKGDTLSTHVLDQRIDTMLEIKDVERHPNNPDIFVPEGSFEDTDQAPAVDRKEYGEMDRDEKIAGVRVALARTADQQGGSAAFEHADVVGDVFYGGQPSKSTASALIEDAVDAPGFARKSSKQEQGNRLTLELANACDELCERAGIEVSTSEPGFEHRGHRRRRRPERGQRYRHRGRPGRRQRGR